VAWPHWSELAEAGGGHCVQLGVAGDLIHRLPDADGSGQVHDPVHAGQGAIRARLVADVADDQLHRGGKAGLGAVVYLLLHRVEDDDVVAAFDQLADNVRADESSSSCDKCSHAFAVLVSKGRVFARGTLCGRGFFYPAVLPTGRKDHPAGRAKEGRASRRLCAAGRIPPPGPKPRRRRTCWS
jgi:hypothetical protein